MNKVWISFPLLTDLVEIEQWLFVKVDQNFVFLLQILHWLLGRIFWHCHSRRKCTDSLHHLDSFEPNIHDPIYRHREIPHCDRLVTERWIGRKRRRTGWECSNTFPIFHYLDVSQMYPFFLLYWLIQHYKYNRNSFATFRTVKKIRKILP